MALEDYLIAMPGQMVKTASEPWTPEYRRKQEADQFALKQARQQEVRAQEAHKLKQEHTKLAIDEINDRMTRLKTEREQKDFLFNQKRAAGIFEAAHRSVRTNKKGGVRNGLQILQNNKQALYDALDDDQDELLTQVLESKDPRQVANFINSIAAVVPEVVDHLNTLEKSAQNQRGGTAAERITWDLYRRGVIDADERDKRLNKASKTKVGTDTTAAQEAIQNRFNRKDIKSSREEAAKAGEYFKNISTKIETALNAMDSGDNKLAEDMMVQAMSQAVDSKVRAVQMHNIFDASYGNVAKRGFEAVNRFIAGNRTEAQRTEIKQTLKAFLENYARPGSQRIRDKYRGLAREGNKDPYQVVPPTSAEDVRRELQQGRITEEQALKYMKQYNFPVPE